MKRLTKHLIVRYLIAGGTSALINLGVLSLLYYVFGVYYLYAAIIASVIAFFVSLVLHKFWTFQDFSRTDMHVQAGKYMVTSLFGLGLNTLFLYILVDHFHLFVYLAQIVAGGSVACITFFISRGLVFEGKKDLFTFDI
ncbi:MAG: GtrA-like protein [Candidatus Parcubacteria bacterium]|jgi:putative flippase GtrA